MKPILIPAAIIAVCCMVTGLVACQPRTEAATPAENLARLTSQLPTTPARFSLTEACDGVVCRYYDPQTKIACYARMSGQFSCVFVEPGLRPE